MKDEETSIMSDRQRDRWRRKIRHRPEYQSATAGKDDGGIGVDQTAKLAYTLALRLSIRPVCFSVNSRGGLCTGTRSWRTGRGFRVWGGGGGGQKQTSSERLVLLWLFLEVERGKEQCGAIGTMIGSKDVAPCACSHGFAVAPFQPSNHGYRPSMSFLLL